MDADHAHSSDAVRTIVLPRTAAGAYVDEVSLADLLEQMVDAAHDRRVAAVVLSGQGRSFCAGASPDYLERLRNLSTVNALVGSMAPLILEIQHSDVLWVSAITGPAIGLGLFFALLGDHRIAASHAALWPAFARYDLPPEYGTATLLARDLGHRRALDFLLESRPLDSTSCRDLGLVDRVLPAAEVTPAARAWAYEVCSGMTVEAARMTKRLMSVASSHTLNDVHNRAVSAMRTSLLRPGVIS